MAQTRLQGAQMVGVVCAVPGDPVDIRALNHPFTPDEIAKLARNVGLGTVHRAAPGQSSADLCTAAAQNLLAQLAWAPESVDGLIFVSQTPDYFLPATACVAHQRLALGPHCLAFDVGMGCSGYVYGLLLAAQMLQTGTCKRLLLLAGETPSRMTDSSDKSVAVLFGDAGSATALEAGTATEPWSFILGTDGAGVPNLMVPGGAFRALACDSGGTPFIKMNGLEIFDFTMREVPGLVQATMDLHGWRLDEVDHIVLHQANEMILRKVQKKLQIPDHQFPVNIGRYGNTSMVSIPLLLADTLAEPLLGRSENRTVMAGFGVGYSWAGLALSLNAVRVAQVITC